MLISTSVRAWSALNVDTCFMDSRNSRPDTIFRRPRNLIRVSFSLSVVRCKESNAGRCYAYGSDNCCSKLEDIDCPTVSYSPTLVDDRVLRCCPGYSCFCWLLLVTAELCFLPHNGLSTHLHRPTDPEISRNCRRLIIMAQARY